MVSPLMPKGDKIRINHVSRARPLMWQSYTQGNGYTGYTNHSLGVGGLTVCNRYTCGPEDNAAAGWMNHEQWNCLPHNDMSDYRVCRHCRLAISYKNVEEYNDVVTYQIDE